ncbi:hypothetical protein WDU94_002084 [Cyamophila willieti]
MGDDNGSSLSPLEVGIGLRCNDFVIMMSDKKVFEGNSLSNSVDIDKISSLDNGTLLMCLGGSGPVFKRSVVTGMTLHRVQTNSSYPADQTGRILSQTLRDIRRHTPCLNVNLMLGTAEPNDGVTHPGRVTLYKGDSFGFMLEVPHAYIGINGLITATIVDKYYRPDLTIDAAYSLLKQCVHHMKRRTFLAYPTFTVKVLDISGQVHHLPDIKWTDFDEIY